MTNLFNHLLNQKKNFIKNEGIFNIKESLMEIFETIDAIEYNNAVIDEYEKGFLKFILLQHKDNMSDFLNKFNKKSNCILYKSQIVEMLEKFDIY